MRLPLAALVLALAACGPADGEAAADTAPPAAASTPAAAAAGGQENGTFRIVRGDSTIVTIRFQRTPVRIQSEIFADSAAERVVYTADLNPDATVAAMQLQAFTSRDAREPKARANLQFRGDSAFFESVQDGETQKDRTQAPRGVIPIPVAEAVGMIEQVLRRARSMGGTTAEVPVVALEGGAKLGTAAVTFMGADSARLQLRFPGAESSSNELIVATDAAGRLLGGRAPKYGYVIRRDP
jgi:hypothetical protein